MNNSAEIAGSRPSALRAMRRTFLALVALYVLAMIWVWAGVFEASGGHYGDFAAFLTIGFAGAAAVLYFLVLPVLRPIAEVDLRTPADVVAIVLIFVAAGLALVHWLALGRIPVIAAFATNDEMQAALIRDSIIQTRFPLLNYIPTIVIRGIAPFLGIYFISRRRYGLAWIAMIVGLIYGVSLMQKSYPLMILAPPALYCLLTRRFGRMAAILAVAAAGVLLLFFAAAPAYRPIKTVPLFHNGGAQQQVQPAGAPPTGAPPATTEAQPPQDLNSMPAPEKTGPASPPAPAKSLAVIAETTVSSLAGRVFQLPGEVVANWFSIFPEKLSYEKGCGYQFVAPFIHCAFENTPARLYAYYYPDNAKAGIRGTYNAAHFAEEYANFGSRGLFLSGVLAAIALAAAAVCTTRAGLAAAAALNFAPIMALTSADLHTTLLSGGWILVMALAFLLYRPALGQEAQPVTRTARGLPWLLQAADRSK